MSEASEDRSAHRAGKPPVEIKLDVKNGHREVTVGKRQRNGAKALHLTVTKLDGRLYRVEADEPLDDGQYSISPTDSNHVFCFEVY